MSVGASGAVRVLHPIGHAMPSGHDAGPPVRSPFENRYGLIHTHMRRPALRSPRWPMAIAYSLGLALRALTSARAADPAVRESTVDLSLGYEQLKLPGDEKMGLLGGSVLFPLGGDWWAGPAVYGAASGQRGGLFVGGAELQRRFALPWEWD